MNIGIVGLGLIGGTYAKSLRKYPYTIYGIDIKQDTIDYALERDIIDFGTIDPSKEFLQNLDVIFLCLYPNETIKFIQKNIMKFKRNCIVSDVAGIKRKIMDSLEVYKDDEIEFVFAHPIAGREQSGIEYADDSIFKNANFVITPTTKNTKENMDIIEVLARQMGFNNVSYMKDVQHDEIISFTSQLTHAIAISLVNSDTEKYDTKLFIGDSYKDLTRIAKINENLWSELFIINKDFLVKNIDAFIIKLEELKEAVHRKDKDSLELLMREATAKRKKIDG